MIVDHAPDRSHCQQCFSRNQCGQRAAEKAPHLSGSDLLRFTLLTYGVLLLALGALVTVVHQFTLDPLTALVCVVTGLFAVSRLSGFVIRRKKGLVPAAVLELR